MKIIRSIAIATFLTLQCNATENTHLSNALLIEMFNKEIENPNTPYQKKIAFIDSVISLSRSSDAPRLYLKKGKILCNMYRFKEELQTYRTGIEKTNPDSSSTLCKLLFNAMCANHRLGQYDELFNDAYNLLRIEKCDSLKYYDIKTYITISEAFGHLNNIEKCKQYSDKAHALFEKIDKSKTSANAIQFLRADLILNKGNVNLYLGDYDQALEQYKKISSVTDDTDYHTVATLSIALIYQRRDDPSSALKYAGDALSKLKGSKNGPTLAINYLKLCIMFNDIKRFYTVLSDYSQELRNLNDNQKAHLNVLVSYVDAYKGNYKKAFEDMCDAYHSMDSIKSHQITKLSSKYDTDIVEWEKQAQNETHKNVTTWLIFILIILILFVFIFILMRKHKRILYAKKKNSGLQERISDMEENLARQHAEMQSQINVRDEELSSMTMRLAILDKTLGAIKKTATNKTLSDKDAMSKIRESVLSLNHSNDVWDLFKDSFEKSNQKFFDRLYKLHPSLTNAELRMCSFIMMGMTSKEIAAMTNRSPRTVHCIKYNLRQKCGMDETTEHYLRKISTFSDDEFLDYLSKKNSTENRL